MKRLITLFILAISFVNLAMAQQGSLKIEGTVYDEAGVTLPGVSIFLKDKPGVGAASDSDGKFEISASRGNIIVFSFIGYKKYEHLVVESKKNISINLEPDAQQMEEVVVEAFGVAQRKITTTGAVTSVDVGTLQAPATSMSSMLGGRVAGVISMQSSGEPGKNLSEFWIRGIGTFGANSSALVLIDGLEGDLNSLDPADIESFSVLKDASATAMYGVRGANGVVIVTTKRGQEEKLKVDFRANLTYSYLPRKPKYLGSYEYAKLANEANIVRGNDRLYSDYELDIMRYGLDSDFYPNVNWQDEILNDNSLQQTYYVSARGGGSIARYFISLNTSQESSIYKQDKSSKYFESVGYNTYGYRANIDLNLTKTTKVYFGSDGYMTKNTLPGSADTDFLWSAQSQLTPLLIPIVYSDGRLPSYEGAEDKASPYVLLNYTGKKVEENVSNTVTLKLEQDFSMITNGLRASVQGAYTNTSYFDETRYILPELWRLDRREQDGSLSGTRQSERKTTKYSYSEDQYRKIFFQTNINYTKQLDKHLLGALIHYEMSETKKNSQAKGKDEDGNEILSGMLAIPVRYQGVSSRLSYSYDDTYLLDFNFGYTGSENFQPGKRFGFFPSFSTGWVPSSYKWTKDNLSWMEYFKIRASYGIVGNDRISNKRFPYLTQINTSASAGWGYPSSGISESVMGADNLKWEKSKKFDIGIEGKLFNKKIDFTIDYFTDTRDGIFQQRQQVPDYIGLISMPYGNVGSMKSYGADGNISFTHKINKDMEFVIRGNFTYSKNKVDYFEEADTKYEYYSLSGRPLNYQKGLIALGLFESEEDIANSPVQEFGTYMPGDIKYKDVNGDGVVNSDDVVAISYSNYPRLMYGFGFEYRYKKLTVGVLFKGTGNTDYYHVYKDSKDNMGYIPFYGEELGNVLTMVDDPSNRWIPMDYALANGIDPSLAENPNARFPRLSYGNNTNNAQTSTFWKGNSRYLRLQEVNISYQLAPTFLKRIGVSGVDLSLVGNNLLVWDTVKLWDPEQVAKNGRAYPIPSRITFQAYFKF